MRRIRQVIATLVVAGVLGTLSAQASEQRDTSPLRQLRSLDEIRAWQAVGMLDLGGSTCSGVLISRSHVLTAAHCVMDGDTPIAPQKIIFRAGFRDGGFLTWQVAKSVRINEDYLNAKDRLGTREAFDKSRPNDLALIRLQGPITDLSIAPFSIGDNPRVDETVSVISYGRGRNNAPSLQEECHVLQLSGPAPVLNCNLTFGSSGAPVFVTKDGERHVVSVVSGSRLFNGTRYSVGASSLDWVRNQLLADTSSQNGRLVKASGSGSIASQLGRQVRKKLPSIGNN